MKKDFLLRQEQRQPLRELYKWLRSLQSTLIFMQTGAHPDDETSRMLAKLSLQDGMHVVYVNAVRGQGGQNSLGKERGDQLGFLRTEELIAAMRCIRADLGWLAENPEDPIRDFGFSKTPEQTFEIWGREHSLKQLVKMVRLFKPDILIPTFLDVAGQHGHHRAVTQITIEAFDCAADPNKFSELDLETWQANALYLPAWSGGGGSYDDEEPPPVTSHQLNCGDFNFVYGGTYAQIGEWSRGFHATQGMGTLRDEQNWPLPLHQLKTASGKAFFDDLTEGVPKSLAGLADYCEKSHGKKAALNAQNLAEAAMHAFPDSSKVLQKICQLQEALLILREEIHPIHHHRVALKLKQAAMAASEAAHLQIQMDIQPSNPLLGEKTQVVVSWFQDPQLQDIELEADLFTPIEINQSGFELQVNNSPRKKLVNEFQLQSNSELHIMTGWHGVMLSPATLHAQIQFSVNGTTFRRELIPEQVVCSIPPVTGKMTPEFGVRLPNQDKKCEFQIHTSGSKEGECVPKLKLPRGWAPTEILEKSGGCYQATVQIPKATTPGCYEIGAFVNETELVQIEKIAYPHIRSQIYQKPANTKLLILDSASLEGISIGWIDGGADRAYFWASQLGATVTQLDDETLLYGDLEKYEVIVAGVFAGRTRPINLVMDRIRGWIERGGCYVSEYSRPIDNWNSASSSPLPLQPGSPSIRWRVTNQAAPVQFLNPKHPLLNYPNKIDSVDFDGWQKERGLYFASKWDDRYEPLLAMSDPGEEPLLGSLLSSSIGKGRHVHCALNLFYQMDHLVAGAFRLFVNLLSHKS
ncbi:MAG: PIG-L family deacetylase [bacterium]